MCLIPVFMGWCLASDFRSKTRGAPKRIMPGRIVIPALHFLDMAMYPNELFPGWLFQQPSLILPYAFCLSRLSPAMRMVLVNAQPVPLGTNDVAVERPISGCPELTDEEFVTALELLKRLDLVTFTTQDGYYRVTLKQVVIRATSAVPRAEPGGSNAPDTTFRDFSQRYLVYVEQNLAPKTLKNAERVIAHANRHFGDTMLSELGPQMLEEYKTTRQEDDEVSRTTINMDIRTLKAAVEQARIWGYLGDNPFRCVKQLRQERQIPLALSPEEFNDLLSVINDATLQRIVRFAVATGMRRGEILNLKWEDVDYAQGSIVVQSSPDYRVKHGKARVLPMGPEAEKILRSVPPSDPFVFMKEEGTPIQADWVTKAFKAAVRGAGLNEAFHFHNLRHTFASWLVANGVPTAHIKDLLGHAYLKTTEGYVRAPEASLRAAVEQLTLPPSQGMRGSLEGERGARNVA